MKIFSQDSIPFARSNFNFVTGIIPAQLPEGE